jgi:hypothetical protein
MKIEMHCHSFGSDGHGKPSEFVAAVQKAGINGLVLTDHHASLTPQGMLVLRALKAAGIFACMGCEYSTAQGHILIYGVNAAQFGWGMYPEMQRVIDETWKAGGVAIPSHPYRGYRKVLRDDVYKMERLVALEVRNGQNQTQGFWSSDDEPAEKAQKLIGLAGIGGSDAHWPEDIGLCWTEFDGDVRTREELVEALRSGKGYRPAVNEERIKKKLARWTPAKFRAESEAITSRTKPTTPQVTGRTALDLFEWAAQNRGPDDAPAQREEDEAYARSLADYELSGSFGDEDAGSAEVDYPSWFDEADELQRYLRGAPERKQEGKAKGRKRRR